MDGEIVTPGNFMEQVRPYLARLTHCFGGIVMLHENGRCKSKGSMVLVKSAAGHFVFTARHVAEEVRTRGGYVFVRPEITEEESLRGHFSEPVRFPVSASDIAWASERMDVAAFRAPSELAALRYLRWFDAGTCSRITTNVRSKWNGEYALPMVIMGCRNYAHFRDDRQETISFLPMLTRISALDPHQWSGIGQPSQIHMEVDDGSRREQPVQVGFRARILASLRRLAGTDQVALGGYSGAPLVLLSTDGEFLIGIVTQGDYVFQSPRACAAAWDNVMVEFGSALS